MYGGAQSVSRIKGEGLDKEKAPILDIVSLIRALLPLLLPGSERLIWEHVEVCMKARILTVWPRASRPSSSPTAQWCDCHPGPLRPAVYHPLWRGGGDKTKQPSFNSRDWQSQLLLRFNGARLLLGTFKQSAWVWSMAGNSLVLTYRDHCFASVQGQLGEVRRVALPWCCQGRHNKKTLEKGFLIVARKFARGFWTHLLCGEKSPLKLFWAWGSKEAFVNVFLSVYSLGSRSKNIQYTSSRVGTWEVQRTHPTLVESFQHRHGLEHLCVPYVDGGISAHLNGKQTFKVHVIMYSQYKMLHGYFMLQCRSS